MPTDEVKRRILAEATAMFLRDGFQKTNLDTLSQILFVSKRTIYKIFGSKKELYRECIKRMINTMEEEDNTCISNSKKPIANLQDFIASHSSGQLVIMEQALSDLNKYFPDIYDECLKISEQRRMEKIIAQINEGQKNGDMYKKLNPEIVAIIIQNILKSQVSPSTNEFNSNQYMKSEIFAEFIHIFMRGLLTEKRIKEYDKKYRT
ncbi:MAG: TetR/AcrR family transcriptional regulator [Bacteroidales bacterium]|nr:TetR/AcrR family transcriptional regulator [Bacteroidales bacterium]